MQYCNFFFSFTCMFIFGHIHGQNVHGKVCFWGFGDIRKALQPSPTTKMAWHSNFTTAAFLPYSACLFAFTPLLLQNLDCVLLASQIPILEVLLFAPLFLVLGLRFVGNGMCWLHSDDPGVEIEIATAVLGMNCILKRNKCLKEVSMTSISM